MDTPHRCQFGILPEAARDLGLGTAALHYQSLGYAVLGLGYGSKRPHPLFEHGVKWATTNNTMVYWLWRQHRAAGIGIATGQASRLLVVDLDVSHDKHGPAEFEGLRDAFGLPLPSGVPVVATPSGGYHLWFRLPERIAPDGSVWPLPVPSRTAILPNVDIKADGGYVVAPPSRVWLEGGAGDRVLLPYTWVNGSCPCEPPMAPPWMIDWVTRTPGGGGSGGDVDRDDRPDVEAARAGGLRPGERNVMLHRIACSLYRRYGTAPDGIAAARRVIDEIIDRTPQTGGFGPGERNRALASALAFVRRAEQDEEQMVGTDIPALGEWARNQA